ncbi:ATP-binding cassette domain-containing protein [Actinosynnema pretiosum]|uniref:ABC transporter permease n=1 Tax=Actinosynnema pretiosum TaxID=42197 RepID=A0A290Z6W8_9PSEU|nr:ATP-binding cassette domain-containing protein [Actinosynnema pretiosum]ATE54777.1 ABC transporter permease [Actinosynnema pretiosum]
MSADRAGRRWLRGLAAALRLSWEADARRSAAVLALFAAQPLVRTASIAALGWFVQSAVDGDLPGVRFAAALAGVSSVLSTLAARAALNLSATLIDRTSLLADRRVQELAHGAPGVEHYSDPAYLDRLALLRVERQHLVEGVDAVGLAVGTLARAAATAALLAAVTPWLLLVPLTAVLTLAANARAEAVRGRALVRASADLRRAEGVFTTAVDPDAAVELRVYGLARRLLGVHREAAARAARVLDRAALAEFGWLAVGWCAFGAGYLAGMLLVVAEHGAGGVGLGGVVLALVLLTTVNLLVALVVRYSGALLRTAGAGALLVWLQERAHALPWPGSLPPPPRLRDAVELDGVSFRYPGAEADALAEVSLRLPAGRVVALVGENGSGKSTLVSLLAGFHRPDRGAVLVDGVDLRELDLEAWRRRCSAAFQDFARLEFALGESVGVGELPRSAPDTQVAALRAVAGGDLVDELPRGLATPLGRSFPDGVGLSGGQWQKVALARMAMRREPLLVLLDEPTAAVDPVAEQEVLTSVVTAARRVAREAGAVCVVVTHRLSTARDADLVVVLSRGRVAEVGGHAELVARGGVYAGLFALQADAYR